MTYRNTLSLTTAALALAATAAVAQNPQPEPTPTPAPQNPVQDSVRQQPTQIAFGQRRLQILLRGITLSPEQQARVDSIAVRYQDRLPTMPVDSVEATQRDSARAAVEQFDREIRGALLPEQQRIWDRNVENAQNSVDVARRPRPGENRTEPNRP